MNSLGLTKSTKNEISKANYEEANFNFEFFMQGVSGGLQGGSLGPGGSRAPGRSRSSREFQGAPGSSMGESSSRGLQVDLLIVEDLHGLSRI